MRNGAIQILEGQDGTLAVKPDHRHVSRKTDTKIEWQGDDFVDWRVIFGPNAPVHPKVASRANPVLELKAHRPEDLRHVKYTVVAWTGEELKDVDPELIVDE